MGAADMKAGEFQSWSSVAPGWRKHDKRLTGAFYGASTLRQPGIALPAFIRIASRRK